MDIEKKQKKYCVNIGPNQRKFTYYQNDILGSGGLGTVYGGIMTYNNANQSVAVKKLHQTWKIIKKKNPYFDKQIKILEKLDNPYIIKFYLCYIDPITDNVFIVTERCQPKNLAEWITENKNLSSQKCFCYAYQLIYAMNYMHQQGFMHRDIKPQNILLNFQGNIKITDLGLAKIILGDNIQSLASHTLFLTPIYAAPQIISQQIYSGKCDVWSAGCLIYQMLTGRKLFEKGKTIMLLKKYQKQFRQPEKKASNLESIKDSFWYEVLDKMLTYQDNKRYSFKDILHYFKEENKEKYHISIEGRKQISSSIEQSIGNMTINSESYNAEKQFNIIFILPNDVTLQFAIIKGTTIDEVINEIKTMEKGLRKEINNNDFRITNLSEGMKFDHVKLTHKVEQLGIGVLKVKVQQPTQMQKE